MSEIYEIKKAIEPLASALVENQPPVWKQEAWSNKIPVKGDADYTLYRQYQEFLKIEPSINRNYPVIRFDENGVPKKEKPDSVTGMELRRDVAIVTAEANIDTLDAKALATRNMTLYGNAKGPRNDRERQRGEAMINDAVANVGGWAAVKNVIKNAQNTEVDPFQQMVADVTAKRQRNDETYAGLTKDSLPAEKQAEIASITAGFKFPFSDVSADKPYSATVMSSGDKTQPLNLKFPVQHTETVSMPTTGNAKKAAAGANITTER